MSLDQWKHTLDTNLTSSFLVAREMLRGLDAPGVVDEVKDKASIVLIGSTAGKYGEAGHADYAATKSGEFGFSRLATYDSSPRLASLLTPRNANNIYPPFTAMMYGLTLTLKNEIVKIAPKGRVNCIAPGWVKTPMAEKTLQDKVVVQRALATTPLKKVAEPLDVANQILVVSSPTLSGHVSGQVIMVEGGMEGRLLNLPSDFE
ncbi:hypothetical protein HGRIS_007057 [Hohenbuehelia grisea]|uniref:NAD(P)-binding protein n=1 Tax=Hohenbuehelia grisea TaxID=104357 RepID=A0ABR3JBH0_9AGAR